MWTTVIHCEACLKYRIAHKDMPHTVIFGVRLGAVADSRLETLRLNRLK